ncbi:MAG: hypothetical protein HXY40_18635, partial [Chloroflexi bacterium]|nr:hypothetical protein [Chloroflexota bacterium]
PATSAPTLTPYITPTPVVIPPPTPTLTPSDDSLVGQIINGFILPIWEFILTLTVGTVQTLWRITGERGGLGAQAACCGLPLILLTLTIAGWYTRRRRR